MDNNVVGINSPKKPTEEKKADVKAGEFYGELMTLINKHLPHNYVETMIGQMKRAEFTLMASAFVKKEEK